MATAESVFPDQSDFHYDYETLRTTGVILAVVMFVSGILIALTQAHPLPRFQRQKFLLQAYRKCSTCLKGKSDVTGPLLLLTNTWAVSLLLLFDKCRIPLPSWVIQHILT
ncbi:PREDICTED: uncharacterized protein LOC107086134 isoform X1 [Cyprinodon variegatus]|uniref:FXYD domain-containing ion transport regulator n=1 Tax=Cyprinodon variegatus TaxID=28743 RepID=A0A3Q2DVA7_CYPVA|nr:PREDICTED: uncharacterized protein LOC107086134 isoform X1 [Cyprinodon variegatus]